jgi:poly-gamma-glutamate synthesis protein (capsule biosynthesis protein)
VDGLLRTLDFLEEIGIGTFGTYRNPNERENILIREVQGMTFAFLAYTFSAGAGQIPTGREYLVNLMNADLIRADINRARQKADFVIIKPHMGFEYELFVRQEIKDWALLMLAAGADIVVAGHPHVVQPMGIVYIENQETGDLRRGFVAYCLGNFVSSQREIPTETGVILNLYFERHGNNPPTLAAYSTTKTWVKFTNIHGEKDIMVLPVTETLQALENGTKHLRTQDIARLHEIAYIITQKPI